MRHVRLAVIAVVITLLCGVVAATVMAATGPVLPEQDPFYTYTGSLTAIAPGTVLRTRQVPVADVGLPTPIRATQVLYRTQGELGQPTVTVATIIRPLLPSAHTKIVSYQTAYDAVSGLCAPSYTLQGGDPGNVTAGLETNFMLAYVAAGDTVVTSDYEGETYDYGSGQEAGYDTLDAIRAAEGYLNAPAATTPVGMIGYSGGATATDYAAELAPTYAPSLDIVGAAEGGVPADFAHSLKYVDGTPSWSGVIPPILVGLARGFHVNLTPYLSPLGVKIIGEVQKGCLGNFLGVWPGLTIQELVKPQYQNWEAIPAFQTMFNRMIMSRTGTPKVPMLIGNGDSDGTGDGVMIVKDVQALAHTYCQRGVSVSLSIYNGLSHDYAVVPFEVAALSFLQRRLDGQAVPNDCSTIPVGNALTPLPTTATVMPRLIYRFGGITSRPHVMIVYLSTNTGTLTGLRVELLLDGRSIASARVTSLTTTKRRVLIALGRHPLAARRYTISFMESKGHKVLVRRSVSLGQRG